MLWLPLAHWRDHDPTPRWLEPILLRTSYTSMAFLSLLLGLVALRDIAGLLFDAPFLFGTQASTALLTLAVLLLSLGTLGARRSPRIDHVKIKIPNLSPELHGFRIVQISDLHIGAAIKRAYVDRVVALVNQQNADVVAMTGDIFDGDAQELDHDIEPLSRLKSNHGSFYVTGNHEYYWSVNPWLKKIERLGIRTLNNEHVLLRKNGAGSIAIAGVPDRWAHGYAGSAGPDPKAAIANAPANAVKVLLSHQPQLAEAAKNAGFSLMLSGHTHGGQFFPWVFVVRLFHRFSRGLYQWDGLAIYVNRGTGFWGPPIRLGSRSEISVLELQPS